MRKLLKLAALLQQIVEEENLQGQFEWPVPEDCPIAVPDFAGDCFKQNVYLKEHYAPQLQKFEQQTIFNLMGCTRAYVPKPQACLALCSLIKALVSHPDTPWQKPYELEMILFSIAPGYIVQDIQKRIQIRKTAAAPAAATRTEMA